jgi:hypothetical protein
MNTLITAALLAAFRFKTPEGWTDLTHCPDEKTAASLPEDVAADVQRVCVSEDGGSSTGRPVAAYAVDLRRVDEKAVATFTASVVDSAPTIDDTVAATMAQRIADVSARKGDKLELVEARAITIAGQKGARLRYLRRYRSDRLDVFVVPHEQSTAMLTFISPMAHYEEYEPVFAAVADNAIEKQDEFTPGLKAIALVSVGLGALLGFYLFVARRRRKAAS